MLSEVLKNSFVSRFLSIQKTQSIIYYGTFILLALYLISVVFQWEFFFFLSLFIAIVLIMALIKFEVALLFIPITLANPYILEETGTKLNISELVLIIIFFVWICRIFLLNERIEYPRKFLFPSLFIIATAALSLLVAHDLITGVKQVIRYIEILLFFFILVLQGFKSEQKIKQVFVFLIIGGLLASCVGLGQFIDNILELKRSARVYGWGSGYAPVIASTIVLSISALQFKEQKGIRILAFITIPIAGLALIVSQTRAWIGALLIVIGILFFWRKSKNKWKIIIITGSVVSLIIVLILTNVFGLIESKYIYGAIQGALRFGETRNVHSMNDASLLLRFNAWMKAIILYINHPILGIGVGNFRIDIFTQKLANAAEGNAFVDNQYIQGFTEAGTIAGIAWIVFVYRAVQVGIKSVQSSVDSNLYVPAVGLYGSLLLLVIGSFFWVITPVHDVFCIMILYVGLLINILELNTHGKLSKV